MTERKIGGGRANGGLAALAVVAGLAGCATPTAQGPTPPSPERRADARRCMDLDFPIYFERGSDRLTPDARKLLGSVAAQARGCTVAATEVVGLTPPEATAPELALSRLRAVEVAQAIAAAGLPPPGAEVIETRPAKSRVRLARQSARVVIRLRP